MNEVMQYYLTHKYLFEPESVDRFQAGSQPCSFEEVTAETKLKRYLHFASEDGIYIPGCRFHFKNYSPERLTSLDTLISEGKEDTIIDTILKVHNDKTSPYPEALVFVLTQCMRNKNCLKLKEKAYKLFEKICSSAELLFLFFKFSREINPKCGTGRPFRRAVRNWYLNKTALDLADIVTGTPRFKGWRHADVIKLAHVKSTDTAKAAVLRYMAKGLESAEEEYKNVPEAEEVLKHLSRVDSFRKETDPGKITRTIDCYMLTVNHLNHHLLEDKEVWTALIRLMPIPTILERFQFLSKKGMFRKERTWDYNFISTISDALQNPASIKSSGLHPSRVYIELCTYKNAARMKLDLGTKLESSTVKQPPAICDELVKSLEKVFRSTFKMLEPTGRSFVVAIDFDPKMQTRRCGHCPYITCSEAANLITLCLLKGEKNVDVLTFSDIDSPVKVINIPADASIDDVLSTLKKIQVGAQGVQVKIKNLFTYATKTKKKADIFVILTTYVRPSLAISEEFKKYKDTIGSTDARLVICNLSGIRMKLTANRTLVKPDIVEGNDIFTISGFNDKFCKILDAFSKGAF